MSGEFIGAVVTALVFAIPLILFALFASWMAWASVGVERAIWGVAISVCLHGVFGGGK